VGTAPVFVLASPGVARRRGAPVATPAFRSSSTSSPASVMIAIWLSRFPRPMPACSMAA